MNLKCFFIYTGLGAALLLLSQWAWSKWGTKPQAPAPELPKVQEERVVYDYGTRLNYIEDLAFTMKWTDSIVDRMAYCTEPRYYKCECVQP